MTAAGTTAAVAVAVGCSPWRWPRGGPSADVEFAPSPWFPEGVLSGDPVPGGVVLWTRVAPELDPARRGVPVQVEVASDGRFRPGTIVHRSTALAHPSSDHTVRFPIAGLRADAEYWYRFTAGAHRSGVGRTRTAPAPWIRPRAAAFGFFSCQRYTHGFFHAHADMAQRDLDFVVCLGDYVYDTGYADGVVVPGRDDPIQDATSLEDFRAKYALYRSDPMLQAMHARFPFVAVPDNHDAFTGPWEAEARAGALQAYFEHMPVRRFPDAPNRFHRRIRWGRAIDLLMLDLRQYRSPRISDPVDTRTDPRPLDPARSILGADQKAWLFDALATSDADWKVLGNQVMLSPWRVSDFDDPPTRAADPDLPRNAGVYVDTISWDGFQSERRELLTHLDERQIRDVIAVTGDAHIFWAADLQPDYDDPASPSVLSEFVGGSICSGNGNEYSAGSPTNPSTKALFPLSNSQHLRFVDTDAHGYGIVALDDAQARVEFIAAPDVKQPGPTPLSSLATFTKPRGVGQVAVS